MFISFERVLCNMQKILLLCIQVINHQNYFGNPQSLSHNCLPVEQDWLHVLSVTKLFLFPRQPENMNWSHVRVCALNLKRLVSVWHFAGFQILEQTVFDIGSRERDLIPSELVIMSWTKLTLFILYSSISSKLFFLEVQ
jgi:hypothetical protein